MPDIVYERRFGDRKEGRKVRTIAPFYKIMPYLMVTRDDACNYFSEAVEITQVERWLRAKRLEGYKGMGMLHLFIAAYVRACASVPSLNRFISGQKIYARNDIIVCMTVKRTLTRAATETTIKVHFDPADTIYDVYRKVNEKVEEIKSGNSNNNTENTAEALFKLPGLCLKFAVWLLRLLDYFDLLPQALLDASPFHASMFITDIGSLGIQPIYHHIYNFGNVPLFISFGAKRRSLELDREHRPVERKYIDFKVVCDERIQDGFSYASAFKYLKAALSHPEALEVPPEKVLEDVM
ncbi:MAG: hypothetical protein LUE06_06925 [Oscillospiraceae bacterium]|nr:hypothetical protein [Oscillospiraceae bacterium]